MKRGRSYNDDENNIYCRRPCPVGRNVPIRNPTTNTRFEFYNDLIDASTAEFVSKHLITHEPSRKRLFFMCDDILGRNYEAFIHTTFGDEIYQAVNEACSGLAWMRLRSIVRQGYFTAGEYRNFNIGVNTLIVSSDARIFLHLEKSNYPGHILFLRIEEKREFSEMMEHFKTDADGKIYHFKP